jgi:hypothetical protein
MLFTGAQPAFSSVAYHALPIPFRGNEAVLPTGPARPPHHVHDYLQ